MCHVCIKIYWDSKSTTYINQLNSSYELETTRYINPLTKREEIWMRLMFLLKKKKSAVKTHQVQNWGRSCCHQLTGVEPSVSLHSSHTLEHTKPLELRIWCVLALWVISQVPSRRLNVTGSSYQPFALTWTACLQDAWHLFWQFCLTSSVWSCKGLPLKSAMKKGQDDLSWSSFLFPMKITLTT